eukprot:CAMPEP_0172638958 /NCGR_PEP_ID=MMETSP1068-20121228/216376_1 /TAXON_ID=35684 /ORGANISM="Pseudopedinella elastica, Strain CCMP716" /LENGTH=74 /DNA_ID=CAMNT_0013451969 /DNA_START=165 /DNA_END=389 /DNA_ORIENTATION=+
MSFRGFYVLGGLCVVVDSQVLGRPFFGSSKELPGALSLDLLPARPHVQKALDDQVEIESRVRQVAQGSLELSDG